MPTRLAPARDVSVRDRAALALGSEWQGEESHQGPWAADGSESSRASLAARAKADMRSRYERGLRPSAAEYLEHFPALREEKERALSLIYEEFCLREELGERPDAEEFCARYPSWRDSLASQLRYHELLSRVVAAPSRPPRFPEPGERFQEFRLDSLLGRGGAARVYLARDESLGGRVVALKVSPDRGNEPSILGRLDHAHIVRVLSVVFDSETGLRGLCMPYRPGLSLDEVIRRLNPSLRPRSARALHDVVFQAGPAAPAPPRESTAWTDFPLRGTHAEAVAWVIADLARALAYAHKEGILHRDVKPANVLLTPRDGPQLLDFNLAHEPHSPSQAEAALRGGTLPYMAPEQLEAFLDSSRWDDVGRPADLYSLGLVLLELLTGQAPGTPDPKLPLPRAIRALLDQRAGFHPAVRAHDRTIPHALEAIVERCLAPAPADRYPDAQALADDLDLFRARRPLRHAQNRSRQERTANWVRRNRLVLGAAALCCGLLAASLPAQFQKWVPVAERAAFLDAVESIDAGEYRRAIPPLRSLIGEVPDSPLAGFYLGFALEETGAVDEGAGQLAGALNSAGAMDIYLAWGRRHPNFSGQLTTFGQNLNRVGRKRYDKLARDTIERSLRLDPKSVRARGEAAYIAECDQNYDRARALLTGLIEEAERRDNPEDRSLLGGWRLMRARVAVISQESRWRSDPLTARVLISQAIADLDRAETVWPPADRRGSFQLNYVRVEALIALGDLEFHLRQVDAATGAYRAAEKIFRRIEPRDFRGRDDLDLFSRDPRDASRRSLDLLSQKMRDRLDRLSHRS